MSAWGHKLLTAIVCAVALVLVASRGVHAQALPPAPVPVTVPADPGPPPPVLGSPTPFPGPSVPPPPPPPSPFAAPPLGREDVDATSSDVGPFFSFELGILKPSVKNQLSGPVLFTDGSTGMLRVPQASLDWNVAPRFEMGYRFADGFGDLSASYRFLLSEGANDASTDFGPSHLRSRLDLNQFDFDYTAPRYSPGPFWDLKYRIGARLADVYFDSQQDLGFASLQESNNFVGAGPHFGLDAERRFGLLPGFAAFGRLDGAVLVGQVHQKFHVDLAQGDGQMFSGDFSQQRTQSAPVLTLQTGISYTPPRMDFIHFTAGYEFERWWNIGHLNDSRGELTDQGFFLRGEFDY